MKHTPPLDFAHSSFHLSPTSTLFFKALTRAFWGNLLIKSSQRALQPPTFSQILQLSGHKNSDVFSLFNPLTLLKELNCCLHNLHILNKYLQ